ncbi:uncharacterized protein F5891DRAFT_1186048 [Suillus fuscotomentosus]|uniref:Uncharacterized protein n=1 Tax=Suillus fuscotomentosus TaxID=1912939 RepID=A0AAD4EBI3_9AGAM|nr:uncharacterized protein F5891DRAFT_1186048 [Suillus fuscotomentosus]KAG1902911.1 hypothetical protein F5891DRAFT_1186048 [Suillus fuscotomentosus]
MTEANIRSAAIEEGVANSLYGMAINVDQLHLLESVKHLVVTSRALVILHLRVPFPTDKLHDPLFDSFSKNRFSLSTYGGPNMYLLSNKYNYDEYIIYYEQLCNPVFDMVTCLPLDPPGDSDLTESSDDVTLCGHIYYEVESSDEYVWDTDGDKSGWKTTNGDTEDNDIPFLFDCEISDEEKTEDISLKQEESEDITHGQEEIEDIIRGAPPATISVLKEVGDITSRQEEIEDITGGVPIMTISELFCATQSK